MNPMVHSQRITPRQLFSPNLLGKFQIKSPNCEKLSFKPPQIDGSFICIQHTCLQISPSFKSASAADRCSSAGWSGVFSATPPLKVPHHGETGSLFEPKGSGRMPRFQKKMGHVSNLGKHRKVPFVMFRQLVAGF